MGETFYQIAVKFSSAKKFVNALDPHVRYKQDGSDVPQYHIGKNLSIPQDASHKDHCKNNEIPLHAIVNMILALYGDYPVPYFRSDFAPETTRLQQAIEMAHRARVEVQTAECNRESMWTDKAQSSHPSPKKSHGCITLDGITYDTRATPSFYNLQYIAGKAEWDRIEAMFASYLGDNFILRYSMADAISEVRKLYKAGNVKAYECYASGECLANDMVKTYIKNSIIDPIKLGRPGGTGSTTVDKETGHVKGKFQIFRISETPSIGVLERVVHGIENNVCTLSGVIHLKVTEDEANAIMSHGQVASILDGGVAIVDTDASMDDWTDQYEQLARPYEA